ncbi:hypothetical protein SAMN05443247_11487 [Bradyrhizobium erythrophlei]|nr:hypothetical protein SAMN05443247_11487 [Bradyrhizobium erythrophlei]
MTDATDKVACGDDLERMLRFLLRGDPRDEGLDSVDQTADWLSGAGLETRGQGFEARREDPPGQAITVEGFPARTEKRGHYQGFVGGGAGIPLRYLLSRGPAR